MKLFFLIFLCFAFPCVAQTTVGNLQVQNYLSEIASAGSAAQTAARNNIGAIGTVGVTLTDPTIVGTGTNALDLDSGTGGIYLKTGGITGAAVPYNANANTYVVLQGRANAAAIYPSGTGNPLVLFGSNGSQVEIESELTQSGGTFNSGQSVTVVDTQALGRQGATNYVPQFSTWAYSGALNNPGDLLSLYTWAVTDSIAAGSSSGYNNHFDFSSTLNPGFDGSRVSMSIVENKLASTLTNSWGQSNAIFSGMNTGGGLNVDMTQATGGSTAIAINPPTSIVGALVVGMGLADSDWGKLIPVGDTVSATVLTPQVTFVTTSSSPSGANTINVTSNPAVAVGQQCLDTTNAGYIANGALIASIISNMSVTLTNTGGSPSILTTIPPGDTIKCDPVLTLANTTTTAVPSGTGLFYSTNEGGTGGGMQGSLWRSETLQHNFFSNCQLQYGGKCAIAEEDMNMPFQSYARTFYSFVYGSGDLVHAYGPEDSVFSILGTGASNSGGARQIINIGAPDGGFPFDAALAAGGTSWIVTVLPNQVNNLGFPWKPEVSGAFDFRNLVAYTGIIRSNGYLLDGSGQQFIGPGSITINSDYSGLTIGASYVTEETATVASTPCGNPHVGDDWIDANGGQWQVATVSGCHVTGALVRLHAGYAATCPSGPITVVGGNTGNAASSTPPLTQSTITVTCSSAATKVTLGATGNIVNIGSGAMLQNATYTISTLPTCSGTPMEVYISNGVASPTYNGTVSTTGTTAQKVFCNGTNWTYH